MEPSEGVSQKTLLVVDDEWLICSMLADHLRSAGFKVMEALNAEKAMMIIADAPVDLVISDITMPGKMNGIGLARWLLSERPRLPVILISGGSEQEEITASFGNAVAFFSKPCSFRELENYILGRLQGAGTAASTVRHARPN